MRPVIFFPISDKNMPSSRYRVYLIEKELRSRGYETLIVNPELTDGEKRVYLNKLQDNSILYVQKVGNTFHVPDNFLPYKHNHTIIFDFDDYISIPEVNNMCAVADYIVCGSHFLYEYSRRFGKKSYLIECCQDQVVPCVNKDTENNKKLRIVWSHCFAEVYADDILSVSNILSKLHEKYDFELILCGFRNIDDGLIKHKVKENLPFAQLYDSLPVDEYNAKILPLIAQADIAVVPFIDNESRKGKAGLSLRNYMMMGLPTVASAVGEHNYIIEDGKNGFLAHNEADWERFLSLLCENESIRRQVSEKAKSDVCEKYSLESRADLLEKVISETENKETNCAQVYTKKSCAVVLGRCSADNKFIFESDVRGYSVFHWIELFLLNTRLINKVIFAFPDDDQHRKIAKRFKKHNLNIELGNPDDTTGRFLSVVSPEYDFVFRFTLEKPFIDNLTIEQMLALLTQVDAVSATDELWGINIQGYNRKIINHLNQKKDIKQKSLWQTAKKLPEFATCDIPFLLKPQYENIKVSLETKNDLTGLSEFILSPKEIVFEKYQKFYIKKIENFNAPIYERIKNKKISVPEQPVVCDVVIDKHYGRIKSESDFSIVLYENENIIFYEEKSDSIHVGIPEQEKVNFDFLDLVIENVSSWCRKNKCDLILSKDYFSTVFAVKLANSLNLPVFCYLNKEIDPKDLNIKHYLKMADKVFNADGVCVF